MEEEAEPSNLGERLQDPTVLQHQVHQAQVHQADPIFRLETPPPLPLYDRKKSVAVFLKAFEDYHRNHCVRGVTKLDLFQASKSFTSLSFYVIFHFNSLCCFISFLVCCHSNLI